MTFSVNGVALDNPDLGWVVSDNTQPLSALTLGLQSLTFPGRDGAVAGIPAFYAPPTIPIAIFTPRNNVGQLLSLFTQPNSVLTDSRFPDRQIGFEFASSTSTRIAPADAIVELVLSIRLSGVFWRDVVGTQSAQSGLTLTTPYTITAPWLHMTAPVGDAQIQLNGPFTSARVTDSVDGSGFVYTGTIADGKHIMYDMLALTATTDAGVDVSGNLDFIGYRFRINPTIATDDAQITAGAVVATVSGGAADTALLITGKGAYLV